MAIFSAGVLSSCGEYNKVLKSTDNEYKYEAAKSYFAKGQNSKAATLLEDLALIMKGTSNAEESAYMLAMTYYNQGDYITASHYFNTYYTTYPRGTYTELARFYSGKALYLDADNHSCFRVYMHSNYFALSAQNVHFILQRWFFVLWKYIPDCMYYHCFHGIFPYP